MRKEMINKIYEAVINGMILTDKLLQGLGIFNKEIDELLRSKILKITTDGKYQLTSVEGLRLYGIELLRKKYVRRANLCFKKCCELAPYDRNANLQLLLAALVENDFNKAENIFINLEKNCTKEEDKGFNNTIVYLLSCLTTLPEEYSERARNMQYEDIEIDSNSKTNEMELSSLIIRGKFPHAFHVISEIIKNEDKYSVELDIIKELLYKTVISEKKFRTELKRLAYDEQYKQIIIEIDQKRERRKLRLTEENSYLIAKAILEIIETGILQDVNDMPVNNLHDALVNKNFKLAEKINETFLSGTDISKSEDIVSILLSKINKLIDELGITPKKEEVPFIFEEEKQDESKKSEDNSMSSSKEDNDSLSDIEDLAYYIASQNMNLETAKRKLGILTEQVLLIKLVYARDYYIEENYLMGDKLIKEVEVSFNITPLVTKYLNEIKENRNIYKEQRGTSKKRTKK